MKQFFYKEILVHINNSDSFTKLISNLRNTNYVLKREDLLSIFIKSPVQEKFIKKILNSITYKEYPVEKPSLPAQSMKSIKILDTKIARKGKIGKKNIIIKPGLAFGYDHPATLLIVEVLIDNEYLYKNQRALDVGIGSGILSLLMAKRGASKVIGLDICPFIINEAIENIRKNRIRFKKIKVFLKNIDRLKKLFYFSTANVPINVHKLISEQLKKLIKPHGYILAGGIQNSNIENVIEIYKNYKLINTYTKDNWAAILFQKQDNSLQ